MSSQEEPRRLLRNLVSGIASQVTERLGAAPDAAAVLRPNASPAERCQWHVPSSLPVTYITERVLAAARPKPAPQNATYNDTGRDPLPTEHQRRAVVKIVPEGSTEPEQFAESAEKRDIKSTLSESDSNQGPAENDTTSRTSTSAPLNAIEPSDADTIPKSRKPSPPPPPPPSASQPGGVNPGTLSTFLERRHGRHHFLLLNLSDHALDDRSLLLLRRQVVHLEWSSPCKDRSETPCLPNIFDCMYVMQAYLSMDQRNVVLVSCANGKTRTAIVVACFLKYSGLVEASQQGFQLFLERTCPGMNSGSSSLLPPSLQTFFHNFDDCVELRHYANPKPLLLRAVALQGVPVDDKPCLDIWTTTQQTHVYSSHFDVAEQQQKQPQKDTDGDNSAPLTTDDSGEGEDNESAPPKETNEESFPTTVPLTSQWADEEGFYRVNQVLQGDFVLLCRFGGAYAADASSRDPSKVLFRYANTTGFMSCGTYELPMSKVDMMRRYASSFEQDEFLLTLLLESYWDCTGTEDERRILESNCPADVLPPILHERHAAERGLYIISQEHAAWPVSLDVTHLQSLYGDELSGCPRHILSLALQLTNCEWEAAKRLLRVGTMHLWWENGIETGESSTGPNESFDTAGMEQKSHTSANLVSSELDIGHQENHAILDILDTVKGIDWRKGANGEPLIPAERNGIGDEGQVGTRGEPSVLYEPVLSTNRGDLVRGFRGYQGGATIQEWSIERRLRMGSRPLMPMHGRKRRRVDVDGSIPQWRRRIDSSHDPFQNIGHFTNVNGVTGDFAYDSDFLAAMELFVQIRHTGVTLQDLTKLLRDSRQWSDPQTAPLGGVSMQTSAPLTVSLATPRLAPGISGHSTDLITPQRLDGRADEGEGELETPQTEEGKNVLGLKADTPAQSDRKKVGGKISGIGSEGAKTENQQLSNDSKEKPSDPPLREDPEYAKYFSMLKMGLPIDAVRHALKRDGKDPTIVDLDPEKSFKSQVPEENAQENTPKGTEEDGVPLKEDPEYGKYFRMSKMGLPIDAVKHALKRDGKDPSIIDMDPERSFKSQITMEKGSHGDPPLKDDPEYAKYFKMLKMGLPIGAAKNALQRDGKDPGIMDLDPDKSLKSQTGGKSDDGPPLKDDPEYSKYFRMLKMGLPVGAAKNALQRDGKDPGIMDLDPEKPLRSQLPPRDDGPPLKDDPEFTKYFRMLNMGLPKDAVKHALQRDGKDPGIMDLDYNQSLKSQTKSDSDDAGVPLEEDPEFSKYFKMLKMGLPMGAVKNALQRDGKDPAIMDLDPKLSVSYQLAQKGGIRLKRKEKKRVRRKKIYWTPIDPDKVGEESIWSLVRGSVVMDQLKYDAKEFENLFTETGNPSEKKKKAASAAGAAPQPKKSVQVIDGKRGMNGGIILARIKMEYSKIAEMVDFMDSGNFDTVQLKALKEFLPTDEERSALQMYLKAGKESEGKMKAILADLSECEKYMVAMLDVNNAAEKFDCMLFRQQFKSRLDELMTGVNTVKTACEEVRTSERLRKMMAMILTLVNQINTGGDGNLAVGFSLDALLKLNEAKAFDKKTSVLQYLVKLVKENDPSLAEFKHDIGSVPDAEGVVLDGLVADTKILSQELEKVVETAKSEADRLEEKGLLGKMSVSELSEQRTEIRQISGLPHYNKIDHITGRTPMERFSLRAAALVDSAKGTIDDLKNMYSGVLHYFGEDENMPSNEFFGTMKKFILEFNLASEQVEKMEKARLKEKLRAAAKKAGTAKRLASLAKSLSPPKDETKSSVNGPDDAKGTMKGLAAAAAAKAKNNMARANTIQSENTETIDNRAAARRSSIEKMPHPPPPGGIAALAAAAAKDRKKKPSDSVAKSDEAAARHSMTLPAGIGALAAAAARDREKEADVPPVGGIAALAAAAARQREHKTGEASEMTEEATDKPMPPLPGGIAMLAAAAARNREKPSDCTDTTETAEHGTPSMPPLGGGIAALAAQAARDREKQASQILETAADVGESPEPAQGGAALAAQSAQDGGKKSDEPSDQTGKAKEMEDTAKIREEAPANVPPGGGIAALAAQAARDREKKPSKTSKMTQDIADKVEEKPSFVHSGGIAALAAAAARNRGAKSDNSQHPTDTMEERPHSMPPAGGITALAAQAARDRVKKARQLLREAEDGAATAEVPNEGTSSIPPSGVIAALAAQAARDREKKARHSPERVENGTAEVADEGTSSIPPAGGIAAFAAQAARDREKKPSQTSEKVEDGTAEAPNEGIPSTPNAGGIAALAAEAAQDRERKRSELSETTVDRTAEELGQGLSEGISEFAAQAARESSPKAVNHTTEKLHEGLSYTPLNGGIAALAAQAARDREKKGRESSGADEKSDNGISSMSLADGNASSAAQANRNHEKAANQSSDADVKSDNGSSSMPLAGGIADLVSQAARDCEKEGYPSQKAATDTAEKLDDSSSPTPPASGIAALACGSANILAEKANDKPIIDSNTEMNGSSEDKPPKLSSAGSSQITSPKGSVDYEPRTAHDTGCVQHEGASATPDIPHEKQNSTETIQAPPVSNPAGKAAADAASAAAERIRQRLSAVSIAQLQLPSPTDATDFDSEEDVSSGRGSIAAQAAAAAAARIRNSLVRDAEKGHSSTEHAGSHGGSADDVGHPVHRSVPRTTSTPTDIALMAMSSMNGTHAPLQPLREGESLRKDDLSRLLGSADSVETEDPSTIKDQTSTGDARPATSSESKGCSVKDETLAHETRSTPPREPAREDNSSPRSPDAKRAGGGLQGWMRRFGGNRDRAISDDAANATRVDESLTTGSLDGQEKGSRRSLFGLRHSPTSDDASRESSSSGREKRLTGFMNSLKRSPLGGRKNKQQGSEDFPNPPIFDIPGEPTVTDPGESVPVDSDERSHGVRKLEGETDH